MQLRLVLAIPFFLAAPLAAAQWPAACGADAQQFKVKAEKQPLEAAGDPAKSRIVFIETLEGMGGGPVVRLGIDGSWVSAVKGPSYTVVEVQPGTHMLCGSRQSSARTEKENRGVVKLETEAGKTYFYNFKLVRSEIGSPEMAAGGIPGSSMTSKQREQIDTVEFRPLEQDAGLRLVKKLPRSSVAQK